MCPKCCKFFSSFVCVHKKKFVVMSVFTDEEFNSLSLLDKPLSKLSHYWVLISWSNEYSTRCWSSYHTIEYSWVGPMSIWQAVEQAITLLSTHQLVRQVLDNLLNKLSHYWVIICWSNEYSRICWASYHTIEYFPGGTKYIVCSGFHAPHSQMIFFHPCYRIHAYLYTFRC